MSDPREALARLVRTLDARSAEDQERLGRYWDRGLADGDVQEDVYRRTDAILAEFDVTPRGERVKPSVEDVARALADDWNPDRDPILTAMFRDYAQTVLALLPGRTEAEVRQDEAERIAAWVTADEPSDTLVLLADALRRGDHRG